MDRKKTIKGLHDIGEFVVGRIGIEQARDFLRTIDDAIKFLKKQEQEAQFVQNIAQQISCMSGLCPNCGKMLNTTCNKKFCGECGQAVKWE